MWPRIKNYTTIYKFAIMRYSALVHWVELIGNFFSGVDLHYLPHTDLPITHLSLSAKEYVHINPKFNSACIGDFGTECRPIFPVEGELCPGELGQLPPALEFSSNNTKSVPTHQA